MPVDLSYLGCLILTYYVLLLIRTPKTPTQNPMKRLALAKTIVCIAALLCAWTWNVKANLVADPGFEASADGTGPHPFSAAWTDVDPSGFSGVGGDSAFAHTGNNYAFLGATNYPNTPPITGSLSQNLATTSGISYTLSFFLANDITTGPNLGSFTSFEVLWNGISIFSATNQPAFDYTQFTFSDLVATGPLTTLEFRYEHDNDWFRLDDVSVEVPDSGSTIWLALPIFAGLGLLHFRVKTGKASARV